MAEAMLKHILNARGLSSFIYVDSAGTHVSRDGEPADSRVARVLREHGILVAPGKSRAVRREDFENFDLMLAMDNHNVSSLERLATPDTRAKLQLLLCNLRDCNVTQVPDPYFSTMAGFRQVYTLIRPALERLAVGLARELHCGTPENEHGAGS